MTTDTLVKSKSKPSTRRSENDINSKAPKVSEPSQTQNRDALVDMIPGQRIRIRSQAQGELHIENQNGEVEFSIVWKNGRAQITMSRADLKLDSVEDLNIQCKNFRVASQKHLELQAGGECRIQSNEHLRLDSKVVEIAATLGDVLLQANDFVRAIGEKILLNTDRDPKESEKRAKSFLNKLIGY